MGGKQYEIDVATDNASKLRDALASYVAAARRPGGRLRSRPTSTSTGQSVVDREQNQAVRTWARQRGMKVSDRGRISLSVLDADHGRD